LALDPNPSKIDLAKHGNRIGRLHLTPNDLSAFEKLLSQFSAAYTEWKSTVASKDPAGAVSDRDELIASYMLQAKQLLSPQGWTMFQRYVQGEKSKMTVPQA
jgi:hypothetical protein